MEERNESHGSGPREGSLGAGRGSREGSPEAVVMVQIKC